MLGAVQNYFTLLCAAETSMLPKLGHLTNQIVQENKYDQAEWPSATSS